MEITSGPAVIAPQVPTATLTLRDQPVTIRKLGPLDHMRLFELLGADLSDNTRYLNYAMTAASVTNIGGNAEPFPTSKAQVEAMVQRLGFDGLKAVGDAYSKNFGEAESGEPDAIKK